MDAAFSYFLLILGFEKDAIPRILLSVKCVLLFSIFLLIAYIIFMGV